MSQMTPTTTALVSDSWMHCFVGRRETQVRWAYDPAHDHLAAQVKCGLGWETMREDELVDLRAELEDNDVLTDPQSNDDVRVVHAWPVWAGEPRAPLRQARARGRAVG